MTISAVMIFCRSLRRLSAMLDQLASQPQILQARLHPDMLPFAAQVNAAISFSLRGCCPLAGREVVSSTMAAACSSRLRAPSCTLKRSPNRRSKAQPNAGAMTAPVLPISRCLATSFYSCISCRISIFTSAWRMRSRAAAAHRSARAISMAITCMCQGFRLKSPAWRSLSSPPRSLAPRARTLPHYRSACRPAAASLHRWPRLCAGSG